jgi:hypothetical protein
MMSPPPTAAPRTEGEVEAEILGAARHRRADQRPDQPGRRVVHDVAGLEAGRELGPRAELVAPGGRHCVHRYRAKDAVIENGSDAVVPDVRGCRLEVPTG